MKRFWLSSATRGAWRRSAEAGRSCATGASTPTVQLSNAGWIEMAGLTSKKPGLRMPAEWEPHEATWLAWPHERSDWPGKFAPIPWVYGDIVSKLTRNERVNILVEDAALEKSVRRVLAKCSADLNAIDIIRWPTNRSWTRDYCPIFVRDPKGRVAVTNWLFNG